MLPGKRADLSLVWKANHPECSRVRDGLTSKSRKVHGAIHARRASHTLLGRRPALRQGDGKVTDNVGLREQVMNKFVQYNILIVMPTDYWHKQAHEQRISRERFHLDRSGGDRARWL